MTTGTAFEADYDGLHVKLLTELSPERERCEQELDETGIGMPLPHRSEWSRLNDLARPWFLAVFSPAGRCLAGVALEVEPSRALPGFMLLRVERLVVPGAREARDALLTGLADLARNRRRALRLNVELFSRDEALLSEAAQKLARLGFGKSPTARSYRKTIALDLAGDESEIFAGLHGTARRHVRAAPKKQLEVRALTDARYGERMSALLKETMARTGGAYPPHDWSAILELSRNQPHLSRIVGLFLPGGDAPETLMGFTWGRNHGDHVEYATAASTRPPGIKIPIGYALAWDVIAWARQQDVAWFDFGGITTGSHGDQDKLGGISDFKRYFSKDVLEVAQEWLLEPRPALNRIASGVSAGARWLRRS